MNQFGEDASLYSTLNRAEMLGSVGAQQVSTAAKTPSQINGNSFSRQLLAAAGLSGANSAASANLASQSQAITPFSPYNPYSPTGFGYGNGSSAYGQSNAFSLSGYGSLFGAGYGSGGSNGSGSTYGYGSGSAYGSGSGLGNGSLFGYGGGYGSLYGLGPGASAAYGYYNGQTGQSDDDSGLPDPISTYSNSRFYANVTTSQEEQVTSDAFQFHFPHIEEKDGTYYAYFIDHSGGTENEVGLATSTDGVNFEYQGKVLTRGEDYDAEQASFASVQYDEDTGKWYMLYEAKSAEDDVNSVCLAVSDDGVNWEKKGPVINPGDAGGMTAVDVGTPTFFKEDGTWNVYFHGLAEDGRVRIGYASGESLEDLTVSDEPLLDVDASGQESGTVGARSNIIKNDGWYYMAYESSTADTQYADAQWGTSLARSRTPDGPWEKISDGPILSNPDEGFGYDGPELVLDDGKLYLYYRTTANSTARTELSGLGDMSTATYA